MQAGICERHDGNMHKRGLSPISQFLVVRGSHRWPDGTLTGVYAFIHALYQNVLYYRVVPARRSRLHLRIGLREEAGWGARSAEIATALAAHFEAGQDYARAIEHLLMAGERAARRCAGREAIELFNHGLKLLVQIHDHPQRERYELRLSIALGVPLIQARGYAAREVAEVYGRALELHSRIGEPAQLTLVLWGLWLFEVVRGAHAPALDLGRQLQSLESAAGARFPLAHYATGCSQFWLGDFHGAVRTLDQALDAYDHHTHGQQVGLYSQDPKAVSLLYRGWALWMLGYPDQALAHCEAAVAWADALGHPFSLAFAHDYCAVIRHLRREPAEAALCGAAAADVSRDHGFSFWMAWADMMRAKTLADERGGRASLGAINDALAAYEATGACMGKTLFLALLAEAQLNCGDYAAGLASIVAARQFVEVSGEDAFVAELHRLEGELLLSAEPAAHAAAEACFVSALAHARRQHAKAWELRAATSLARLRLRQAREEEARALVAPVCAWFTEGQATADLLAARALLEALSM